MKHLISILFILLSFFTFAQLNEKFDDGDFDSNPSWLGNLNSFNVNPALQLQLDTTGADTKYLCTSANFVFDAEWEFWLKMNFDPSANNFVKIYLVSDNQILTGSLNGYFIKIVENGSLDAIELYRQNGLTTTLLIRGISGQGAVKPELRVKITHMSNGEWNLYSDSTGGYDFRQEGSVIDNVITSSAFVGFVCKFTASNSKNFFFDEIYAGPTRKDTIQPKLTSIQMNFNKLTLSFNEPLEKNSSENTANYIIYPGYKNPISSILQTNNKDVQLIFSDTFVNNFTYSIHFQNIGDISGNFIINDSTEFYHYKPQKGDIVINEFMSDPYPSNGLPDAEYIELYNSTVYTFPISLNQWKLGDASSLTSLPPVKLKSNDHLILCNTSDTIVFKSFGKVTGISSFPSLNNTGDIIILSTDTKILMDSINYDLSWFTNQLKAEGGWSLERKNPWHPCSSKENWDGSINISGGTPGTRNSVFSNIPDTIAPAIIDFSLADSVHLNLSFSENIDTAGTTLTCFKLYCGNLITKITFPELNKISLTIQNPFSDEDTCSLVITGIKDCFGNSTQAWNEFLIRYFKPDKAGIYDIVISEIFPDPDPRVGLPPYQYIELYNRSNKHISLKDWSISDLSTSATLYDYILFPDSFLILCPASADFQFSKFGKTMALQSFPGLSHTGEEIFLRDKSSNCIFYMNYNQDFYRDNFKKDGGWSLEMIDPENYCQEQFNWKASNDKKGGTPGQINSVNGINPDITQPYILKIISISTNQLAVYFSETMDTITLLNPSNYQVDERLKKINSLSLARPVYNAVLITIQEPMKPGIIYQCSVFGLKDCAGNSLAGQSTFNFGLSCYADSSDLIINEILFNPEPNGYDFVEIYNRSSKIITLKNLRIASLNDDMTYKDIKKITDSTNQILPGQYLALTENPTDIETRYNVKFPEKIIIMETLPAMNDDQGKILIINSLGNVIDYLRYSDDMHSPMLDNKEGVSLERINPDGKTGNISNWHSAASGAGYATPGYENSIISTGSINENEFYLPSKILSPDGDGYEDLLIINYRLDTAGYFGGVTIFDLNGRKIKTLVNNELMEKEGFYSWDGADDNGKKVINGVYILVIKYNRPDGFSKKIKLTCTVTIK